MGFKAALLPRAELETSVTDHTLTLHPSPSVRGTLVVPGDKSISHRYALLGALARGTTTIEGLSPGADVASTLACLRAMGADASAAGGRLQIRGRALADWRAPDAVLDAGNSGTTMRLLAGVLAGSPFTSTITGDDSLRRRPMRRVIDPLAAMGALIVSRDGRAPLAITGSRLRAIDWSTPVASAQVKSAILLAGLAADGTTTVREPMPSRDHTERAFPVFGIALSATAGAVCVAGGQTPVAPGKPLTVPGDPSAAAVWAAAAAMLPGSDVRIEHVGLNPRRLGFARALERMGAAIDVTADADPAGEPIGALRVRYAGRRPVEIQPAEVPSLIDELPVLAAAGALGGGITVSGAGELRVKESDRITALLAGFDALGLRAEERPDGFAIEGGQSPRGGSVDAASDHRLVMAFALLALGASGPTRIHGAGIVAVSYPAFTADLAALTRA
jgi:3-phosphoshikimate 1-carboxyvinyltransferase